MVPFAIHYFLHLLFPGVLGRWLFRKQWLTAWMVMVLTMLIDLDHLLADSVYDPERCSIGFHPLHSIYVIWIYPILMFSKNKWVKWIGLGLTIHMLADGLDCLL